MVYLKCYVRVGLFDTEYTVIFTTATNQHVSLFVPREKVRLATRWTRLGEAFGVMQVEILDESSDEVLIQLPAQIPNGSDAVTVHKKQLCTEVD